MSLLHQEVGSRKLFQGIRQVEYLCLPLASILQGRYEQTACTLRTLEQAAGHLQWEFGCPPLRSVGSEFEPQWRLAQPAKLPSFSGYSLQVETLSYEQIRYCHATSLSGLQQSLSDSTGYKTPISLLLFLPNRLFGGSTQLALLAAH